MGVEVYSVSTDSHFVHKAWHDASESIRKIKYPMLADPTGVLTRAFGVMIEEEGAQFVATHDGEVCPAKWKKGGETLKPSIDLVGKI